MSDCLKKQKEIYKGTEQNRCIHTEAETYRQVVSEDTCEACPVKVLLKERLTCEQKQIQANQLLVIKPQEGYPTCPFRYQSKDGLKCSITNLQVDEEICGRCDAETREHEATYGEKVVNYFGAVRRWVALGRPTRTEEEVRALFNDHCSRCDRYDPEKQACKNCGCTVKVDSTPLGSKLYMASEHCPLGRF